MADNGDRVILKDRFEIKPASRLAQFDHGAAQAFAVEDQAQLGRKLFALIAPGHLPCRGLDVPERRAPTPQLWPEAVGIVDWPVSGQGSAAVWGRRPALVYAQPSGERMAKTDDQQLPHLNEQAIVRDIVKPAILMLRELSVAGLAHRAIRPTNIFYATGNSGEVVFGDCFAIPPGCEQPTIFETVENGVANKLARGPGSGADDLYALGALVAILHMGRNSLQGRSDEEIVAAKLNFGSFSALAGGEKVSPSMAELLRGLLSDKLSDRWTLRNLDMWMLGQYFNPILPGLPQRATRPMKFCGQEYLSRPTLANAMAFHWDEALQISESGALESWMKRGFNDEKIAEPINVIRGLALSYGAPAGAKHRLVSRMIQFLGGTVPICYRSLRCNVLGLGTMLASIVEQPTVRSEFVELIRGRLPLGWLDSQPKLTPDMVQMRRVLDNIEKSVDRPGAGYGVERVLYDLESKIPCRSSLIADYYVTGVADLLPAIDAALPGAEAGTLPMDRHIAAFVAARIGRSVERELNQLANMGDQMVYRLGILRLIAQVQRMHPNNDLPRLGERVLEMLEPVIESFHNLKTREELRGRMRRLAGQSDFTQMADLLDEEAPTRRIDDQGFEAAQRAYEHLEVEAKWLEDGGLTGPEKIHASARMNAAITATFLASAVIACYAVVMAV